MSLFHISRADNLDWAQQGKFIYAVADLEFGPAAEAAGMVRKVENVLPVASLILCYMPTVFQESQRGSCSYS